MDALLFLLATLGPAIGEFEFMKDTAEGRARSRAAEAAAAKQRAIDEIIPEMAKILGVDHY